MAGYDIGPRISIKGEKEFNDSIDKINRNLKEYGSELKAVNSQFEENEKSQDALIAKNKVLQKQYDEQQKKLELYRKELDKQNKALVEQQKHIEKVTAEFGENSKEVKKAQQEYQSIEKYISNLNVAINETTSYSNKLSSELKQNDKYLSEIKNGARDAATGLEKLGDEAKDTSTDLDDIKGTMKDMFSAEAIAEAGTQIIDTLGGIVDESKEYIKIMGTLEQSSKLAGYTTEETAETYKQLYGILADDQTTATTTANLQALGLSQEDLTKMVEGTIGAYMKYGDSIPIDGLAEAINETVKVGKVTGTFADVLNWAGQNEDAFNDKLAAASSESERAKIILQELTNQGLLETADAYRETNKALIENNEATADNQEALADLSETLMPLFTALTTVGTFLLNIFNRLPSSVQIMIVVIVGLIAVFASLAPMIMVINGALTSLGILGGTAAAGTATAGAAATTASVGFGALSASILPIIGIIVAVIAVIALIIVAIKNWDKIVAWFKTNWERFTTALGTAFTNAKNKVQGIIASIQNIFTSLISKTTTWGRDMISGIINGITSMIGRVKNAAKNVANAIASFLHFSRPDEGPLHYYEEWMPDMMKGLSKGIHDNKWRVQAEVDGVADAISNAINPQFDTRVNYPHSKETAINLTSYTMLDGKVVGKSTQTYINNSVSSYDFAKGV